MFGYSVSCRSKFIHDTAVALLQLHAGSVSKAVLLKHGKLRVMNTAAAQTLALIIKPLHHTIRSLPHSVC
jgi:hypothetical protein